MIRLQLQRLIGIFHRPLEFSHFAARHGAVVVGISELRIAFNRLGELFNRRRKIARIMLQLSAAIMPAHVFRLHFDKTSKVGPGTVGIAHVRLRRTAIV